MSNYLRESERYDASLPPIRRQHRPRSPTLHTTEEMAFEDRYRYSRDRETLYHPRPASPTGTTCRKQATDMHDQLRFYREELAKKDNLITELTTVDTPRARTTTTTSMVEDMYSNERMASIAQVKSENAALSVRCDSMANQIREMQTQLDSREEKIRELKLQLEISRESEAKHKALTGSLREKLAGFEGEFGNLEDVASRSSVAVQSLQRQNMEAKARIVELERRIRDQQESQDHVDHDRRSAESRLTEIITQFNNVLALEGSISATQPETLINRVTDIMQENAMLRGKLTTMKEYLTSAEVENKASRETIMRLVTETEREQRNTSKYSLDMDNLRLERDSAVNRNRELEREVAVFRERLDATQRATDATRAELEDRDSRYSRMDLKIRDFELQARNAEASLSSFREQVANILQVEPFEDKIRERLNNLMMGSRDKSSHIDMLESKVTQMTESLESQMNMHRSADQRVRKYEDERMSMEERLRKAESELSAGDVLRDGMRIDKERYLRFLEQVSNAMKMDPITADLGLDSAAEAILCRAEQLVRGEADQLVDRKTHIYNLQRKIKSLKEQMDSKELHMDLLRKKVSSLEERLSGVGVVEREKDEEYVRNKKLVKLCEKYKREINECRLEIRDLKARLLESSDMKTRTLEQNQAIELLESKVDQLERVRERQAQELNTLKEDMDHTHGRLNEKRETAHQTVQALSSELHTTKSALQEVTTRERQLLDLRQVVARMLGMDVNTLAVPDYEILSRLEKLILANQSNAATAIALDTAIEDLGDGFRTGYDDASRALATATRARSPTRRIRSRSVSPNRKRDTRSY